MNIQSKCSFYLFRMILEITFTAVKKSNYLDMHPFLPSEGTFIFLLLIILKAYSHSENQSLGSKSLACARNMQVKN